MTDLQRAFRDAVRAQISTLGISQVELAAQVGCTPKHLSRMLGGYNGGTFELWEALFDALNLQVSVVARG